MSDTPSQSAHSPIADLSYRTYDGPLRTHYVRWWVIARASLRLAMKKRGYWPLVALASFPYLMVGIMLYISKRTGMAGMLTAMGGDLYQNAFFAAYSWSLFSVFLLALLTGNAAIAGDTRANALQVYLSKPITKLDYLVGKWAGLFITVASASLIPATVLYLFVLGLYYQDGFLGEHPALILQAIAVSVLPGVLHTSVLLGFSAVAKTPRVAAALYAAFYFALGPISQITAGILGQAGHTQQAALASRMSMSGILSEVAMHVLDAKPMPGRFGGQHGLSQLPEPPLLPIALTLAGLVLAGLAIARARVRAVEVVRG